MDRMEGMIAEKGGNDEKLGEDKFILYPSP